MKNYTVDNLLFLRKSFPKIYHFVRNRERDSAKYHIELSHPGYLSLSLMVRLPSIVSTILYTRHKNGYNKLLTKLKIRIICLSLDSDWGIISNIF